jgi:hypothetical protein
VRIVTLHWLPASNLSGSSRADRERHLRTTPFFGAALNTIETAQPGVVAKSAFRVSAQMTALTDRLLIWSTRG